MNIMKIRLTVGLCFMIVFSFGQIQESTDSLVNEICKSIEAKQNSSDSLRIFQAYQKHIPTFLENYPEDKRKNIISNVEFRLQRNCKIYWQILNRNSLLNKNWEAVDTKPLTKLNRTYCKDFLKYKKYKYLETEGDTFNLTIGNGYWIDHFMDNTYSKLKFYWINDCEFEIEFIESNNEIRKELSKSGDKYRYQILDKKQNYYEMSVEIPETKIFAEFKLYY